MIAAETARLGIFSRMRLRHSLTAELEHDKNVTYLRHRAEMVTELLNKLSACFALKPLALSGRLESCQANKGWCRFI